MNFNVRFIGFLFLANSCLNSVQCANILALFCTISPSHLIVHMSVVKALADQGHNITAVTSLKPHITHENITNIRIRPSGGQLKFYEKYTTDMSKGDISIFKTMTTLVKSAEVLLDMSYEFVNDERFLALYAPTQPKFDLVIHGYFMNTFQIGVAAKLNVPVIISWVTGPFMPVDDLVGVPQNPAYVPLMGTALKIGEPMTFQKRLRNYFEYIFARIFSTIFDRHMYNYYERAFGNDVNFPDYGEMKQRISLLFANFHAHSEGPVRPAIPAVIEIGGIQIKQQPALLPQHIEEFVESSTHGVILFSLGSNIKGSQLAPETHQVLFAVLSKLKQHVIWKWDDLENVPGNSPNIMYNKWLPQDDLLAHPKTKLLITHAGKGSIAEALYHVVPMLAVPIFGDQPANADKMAASGYGIVLHLNGLSELNLNWAISELLGNPKYLNSVRKFSQLYRDRPLSVQRSIVYWTEYVLRYNGAYHMQMPTLQMNWIESNNLDVKALLLGGIIAVLLFIKKAIQFLFIFCKRSCNLNKYLKAKSKKH